MFDISAYQNPYLRLGQSTMQAVLSLSVAADAAVAPMPLALAIALDRSGSMDGSKIKAAREGALQVVQALDDSMMFVVVAFNDAAQTIYGPATGTREHKQRAAQAIQTVYAGAGTAMSTALNMIADTFGPDQTRAKKILFLTDGKNEGERRPALDRAVARCKASNISINAWGVGTDWDEKELGYMADETHGDADIIPSPQQVAAAFSAAFNQIRKTALADVRMALWTPVGVTITSIEQVYPSIVKLALQPDPANPRLQAVGLGSFAAGDGRDYLLNIQMPVYQPGQQFLMTRPSMQYNLGGGAQEEKSERKGWIFAQWTEDDALAAQIDQHVAHYTNQEELSQNIREGQEALARGDNERATQLLGAALDLSQRTGNEQMTKLLGNIVRRDANGTARLNNQGDAVARKTLAINAGRTSKLK